MCNKDRETYSTSKLFNTELLYTFPSQGVRLKTRIRDKKVKYDAESFAEALISRINETDGSFEAVSSVLEKAGQTLDYL